MCRACQEHRAPNTAAEFRCEARRTGTTTEDLHAAEAAAAYGKPLANPYEQAARERKVLEIVCVLRSRGFTAAQASRLGLSRTARQLMAKEAGQRMPSEKTWTRVVEVMERLETTAPADEDLFKGIGKDAYAQVNR